MNVRSLIFSFLLILVVACNKEEKEALLIAEAVELKKEMFKQELLKECKVVLLQEADIIVDSLIIEKNSTKNIIEKPEKPMRPDQPIVDFIDTIDLSKN